LSLGGIAGHQASYRSDGRIPCGSRVCAASADSLLDISEWIAAVC
jgi:hypothetical protein